MVNWFLTNTERPEARLRLLCFPWAGAGAAAFRDWHLHVAEDVEVRGLQLPGRGWRVRETPKTDLAEIANDVVEAVCGLDDRPTLLFGHSFGAWLGLLVARRLEEIGRAPLALVASGRRSPSHPRSDTPMRHLDDDRFVDEIQRRYGAIDPIIVEDADLLELLLPALRADVAALEEYTHDVGERVECPILAIGGSRDPVVPIDELGSWAEETTGPFERRVFEGGHFYLQDDPRPVLRWLGDEIEARWPAEVRTA
jgi:surfactin synthase thioesterase subunit